MATATLQPKSKSERRAEEIRTAFENAERLRQIWSEQPGSGPPGQRLLKTLADFVVTLVSGQIPDEYAAAMPSAERFAETLCECWATDGFEPNHFEPTQKLWIRWDAIAEDMARASRYHDEPQLEAVSDLLELPGMSFEQIAKMHGLTVAQVIAEKKQPGSVCGESYTPPIFLTRSVERAEEAQRFRSGRATLVALAARLVEVGASTRSIEL